ncbi:MAG TPA: ATP-binding protein [Pyrinomonadaceae bacterium]|jgi:signal transduction histidine kinase
MSTTISPRLSLGNNLLAALPEDGYERLLPHLEYVELRLGEVLHEPDETIRYAYFPVNSVVCLMALMESGGTVAVGIVGREGIIGLPLFLGGNTTSNQAVVQVGGGAVRIKAEVFRRECDESGALRDLLHLYTQALLTQTSQAAACSRLHKLKHGLARWLLAVHDRVDGDEFKCTQELLAGIMGVRRAGVTEAALELQDEGVIGYTRGLIHVADREGLELAACECYELVKGEFDRLLTTELGGKRVSAKPYAWNGVKRRHGELNGKKFETLREINSRLLMAAVREQEARDEAEEANQAKDEFLATLSHELRTPLTAMLGWSRMLRTTKLDEAVSAHALEIIERNAEAQVRLIEDMLDVSRIIAGKLRLEVQPFEPESVIKTAVDAVRPAALAKGIQIKCALDSKPTRFSGDQKRLHQVVSNLLTNAVKFTPEGGSVEVRLESTDALVWLSVSDTGQGISPEFLPHVFDRFRQADSGTTRTSGGLGLGLAIVRHLVELHGGTVRAESRGEGQGATFTVELPLTLGQSETGDAQRSAEKTKDVKGAFECSGSLEGLHVLVVDDEDDTRELLAFVLEQCGAKVTAVASARQALDALARSKPHVLLSDIGMPGEDGYELIRQVRASVRELGRKIPAAALTAYTTEGDRERVLSAGFQVHISKPVEPSNLVAIVAHLAGRI